MEYSSDSKCWNGSSVRATLGLFAGDWQDTVVGIGVSMLFGVMIGVGQEGIMNEFTVFGSDGSCVTVASLFSQYSNPSS